MRIFLYVTTFIFGLSQPGAMAFSADVNSKDLEISNTKNSELLSKISQYHQLEKLTIVCLENLTELPSDIGKLKYLKELNMDNGNGCSMNPKLPDSIGNLLNLQTLNLAGAQDPRRISKTAKSKRHPIPNSLARLKSLEVLDLSRNDFSKIPLIVSKIQNLKKLRLNSNSFEALPYWLKSTSITEVSLGDNCKISGNVEKQNEIKKNFPKISFNFENEYDCN